MEITREIIDNLFSKCFFNDDEIVNGRPTSNYILAESLLLEKPPIAFSANHIQEIKKDILKLIDAIPNINEGIATGNLKDYEWGNIDDLNKIILMGSATSSLNISIITDGDEKIVYLKRDKSHDEEIIEGLPKENIPEQKDELSKPYTKEELEQIKQNGERITEELHEYISIINTGFSFFGIRAEIDESVRNKLNFYDQDNNLLYERVFLDTDGIIGIEGMLNQRLKCEFEDNFNNKITYMYDKRHIFRLNSPEDKNYARGIELSLKGDDYQEISIWTVNPEDEYTIKKLEVTDEYLSLELENAFGPYGNYVDGTTRKISYHSSLHRKPFLALIETVWPRKGTYLYGNDDGYKFFGEDVMVPYQNRMMFDRLATNIVAHPRNREAINYILKEFNKVFPKIDEFAINNSHLLKFLLETPYVKEPVSETLMERAINHACDLKVPSLPKK